MKERIEKLKIDLINLEINQTDINDKFQYYIDKLNELIEYLKQNKISPYFINYINQTEHLTEQMKRTDNIEIKHFELLLKRNDLIKTLNDSFYRSYYLKINE